MNEPNVITPADLAPLREEEIHEHLRIDGSDEANLIERLLAAAVLNVETWTGRALMPQTLELALDEFADEIIIPRPPLRSVTSVKYIDDAGATITVPPSVYQVIKPTGPRAGFGRIVPAYGQSWPAPRAQREAVLVRYEAGWPDADAVPSDIRAAMLLIIGDLYEHREAQVQGPQIALVTNPTVEALLRPYHLSWP